MNVTIKVKVMDDTNNSRVLMTDLISLPQASRESGLSQSHLALLARKGELQAWKFGNVWLTTREAIQKYLDLNKKPGPRGKS